MSYPIATVDLRDEIAEFDELTGCICLPHGLFLQHHDIKCPKFEDISGEVPEIW